MTILRELDENEIWKIYENAQGERQHEWRFKGTDDNRLDNLERANLRRDEDDVAWYIDGTENGGKGNVRLETWSGNDKRWLNAEETVYAYLIDNLPNAFDQSDWAFQLYFGGGHHFGENNAGQGRRKWCDTGCYKVGLKKNGRVYLRKEPQHPVYCKNISSEEDRVQGQVRGRWIGLKMIRYNFTENNRICVALESYIDTASNDNNGRLNLRNQNWVRAEFTEDRGEWAFRNQQHRDEEMRDWINCSRNLDDNVDEGERRRPEHIITKPGGITANEPKTGNLGALRTDGVELKFQFWSMREIRPPR